MYRHIVHSVHLPSTLSVGWQEGHRSPKSLLHKF